VRLDDLAGALGGATLRGEPGVEVDAVVHDSRRARPGVLFCCVPGEHVDGHDFAREAVRRGASALLCARPVAVGVPEVQVADVRAAMAPAAAAVHGHPSRHLRVVGVTGTNGKTTTTHLLQAIFERHGWPTATIGTLSGARTTPEAPELQARLAELRASGTAAVAMEVSSHALALHRVDATWFAAAVFTNLGRDHLDFHGTTEAYFRAKALLFTPERTALAVVNLDDPHGRLLRDAAEVPATGFSLADAEGLELEVARSRFRWRGVDVDLPLGGAFNVANALAAATTAAELGVAAATVAEGLAAAPAVPGRFEAIESDRPFRVVVDYAHTPEGLEQVLSTARAVAPGRVLVVFGCGGDRDRDKRPEMGRTASRLADVVVLTSDNPRHEDPAAILDQVRAGAGAEARVEPDRRAAIALALSLARDGDLVVVAGKGHETTQVVGERLVEFDDRVVVREELERLASCGGGGGR
jgi:UDP-N-acetylmuramoyl-L-alanyl-D-glutamate--2,6-diaminopimelate ligase